MLIQGQGDYFPALFVVKLPGVAFRPRKRQNLTHLLVGNLVATPMAKETMS